MNPKTLRERANTISLPTDREKAIRGTLEQEADVGHFAAKFLRSEYPASDFNHIEINRFFTVRHETEYTYIYW